MEILDPRLWDLENPNLYLLQTTLVDGERLIDTYETPFGIRSAHFDPDKGFFLNAKPVKLKGVCMHHDNGCLGAKVFPRAIERKLEILGKMGCNAIRTSHNPPSQELLDACDRQGFLVMDEIFDEWKLPKTPEGYWKHFDAWYERDVTDFVRRDRNHPSVILWSCGNEVPEQHPPKGKEAEALGTLDKLLAVFHREDPTRPVTQGCNQINSANQTGFADRLDVVGYNYRGDDGVTMSETDAFRCYYDVEHEKYPDRKMLGSENCSAFNTRGVYTFPIPYVRWQKKCPDFHCTSYDITSEVPLIVLKTRPYVAGYFSWTGFDYIGEPTPYPWPARSSQFGIVDLCGFPKDTYFLHKAMWTDDPLVHIVPQNWNFTPGMTIPVWIYSNCEEVELFLNGRSLSTRKFDAEGRNAEYDDMAHVFWDVPYEAGELKAIARKGGEVAATQVVQTTGRPHHLAIQTDRATLQAGTDELAFLTVSACDIQGIFVPDAHNLIKFMVEGPGKIIGVANGNPISHEPFLDEQRHLFNGFCVGVLKTTESAGKITVTVTSAMLESSSVTILSTKAKM